MKKSSLIEALKHNGNRPQDPVVAVLEDMEARLQELESNKAMKVVYKAMKVVYKAPAKKTAKAKKPTKKKS